MLSPFELLYYIGYRIHKKTKGVLQKRLTGYTISVGNLTLGGTGKTPMVMAIAREAVQRDLKTCILTRGYKGRAKSLIVSCGRGPEADWTETGDEAYLMARKLKDVWVVKDSNRYRGGLLAGKKDLYILDDGFQHWALHRDLDIVLIDGTNPFGNGRLLPFGPLREPPDALKRASLVVITKTHQPDQKLIEKIKSINPDIKIFTGNIEPVEFKDLQGNTYPLEALNGRRVFVFSGIGNPGAFHKTLQDLGVYIAGARTFRDHHAYSLDEIKRILRKAKRAEVEAIITTEKDILKLEDLLKDNTEVKIYSLSIEMKVTPHQEFFDLIFKNIPPPSS